MKRVNKTKSKRGFTLIEVMLAIAILMITMESIFSLIISVYNSHREVSYINDATELLELNSLALERSILAFTGSSVSSITYGCEDAVVTAGGSKLFNLDSVVGKNGSAKFSISVNFSKLNNEELQYTIRVIDNEAGTQYGSITNTVWLPHATGKIEITASGSSLKLTKK